MSLSERKLEFARRMPYAPPYKTRAEAQAWIEEALKLYRSATFSIKSIEGGFSVVQETA